MVDVESLRHVSYRHIAPQGASEAISLALEGKSRHATSDNGDSSPVAQRPTFTEKRKCENSNQDQAQFVD